MSRFDPGRVVALAFLEGTVLCGEVRPALVELVERRMAGASVWFLRLYRTDQDRKPCVRGGVAESEESARIRWMEGTTGLELPADAFERSEA